MKAKTLVWTVDSYYKTTLHASIGEFNFTIYTHKDGFEVCASYSEKDITRTIQRGILILEDAKEIAQKDFQRYLEEILTIYTE